MMAKLLAAAARVPRLALLLGAPRRMPRRYQSGKVEELYDLVVVGASVEGSALACSIGTEPSLAGRRVLLVDSDPSSPRAAQPGSSRVCILSRASHSLLDKIGVWESGAAVRANPFSQIYVWDACSDARLAFNRHSGNEQGFPDMDITSDDIIGSSYRGSNSGGGEDVMGWSVEEEVVLGGLTRVLGGCEGVEVQRGVEVTEVTRPKPQMERHYLELSLSSGQTLSTRLLVGCDGVESGVRRLCGLQQVSWDHRQTTLLASLHLQEGGSNSTVWQKFLPSGPIAMLPLSPSQSSLLWTTTPQHAHTLLNMEDSHFVEAVNSAFFEPLPEDDVVSAVGQALRDTLGMLNASPPPPRQLPPGVSSVSDRTASPVVLAHCPHYVTSRVALLGDAAHSVQPLAGLGLSLGLGDVVSLTALLLQAHATGEDWGGLPHLLQYETSRQRHAVPAMTALGGLNLLFSTSWAPAVLLRSLSLQLTHSLPTVKDMMVEYAEQ